jgi:hypothetical protein
MPRTHRIPVRERDVQPASAALTLSDDRLMVSPCACVLDQLLVAEFRYVFKPPAEEAQRFKPER